MKNRGFSRSRLEEFAIELGCLGLLLLFMLFLLTSCTAGDTAASNSNKSEMVREKRNGIIGDRTNKGHLTTNDYVRDIVNHPAFKGIGDLMLPLDDNADYYNVRLNQVGSLMPYHSHVNPDIVVSALNHLIDEVNAGETIFYDFHTAGQKQDDLKKTGLFFYRGKPGAPFAIICPGGGFSYVGSLHEGFPLAWEMSKKG